MKIKRYTWSKSGYMYFGRTMYCPERIYGAKGEIGVFFFRIKFYPNILYSSHPFYLAQGKTLEN